MMERRYKKFPASDEQIKNKKSNSPEKIFQNKIAEVRQRAYTLKDVYGVVKLVGTPHYSLALDTGPSLMPLTLVDSAKNVAQWMSAVGKNVMVYQLLVVCEDFKIFKESSTIEQANFLVKWENVRILDESSIIFETSLSNKNEDLDMENSTNFQKPGSTESIHSQKSCLILVHHVSTPFYVDDDKSAVCLAFISYFNTNCVESKLWMVLKAEQVAWREFLVPNREYLIRFPIEIDDQFFFDKSQKPLDKLFEKNNRELRVIFHHKQLFSKYSILNGSVIPRGSRLFLCGNTSFSDYVYRYTADPLWFRFWFSVSEADHASTHLVTFYGKVDSVIYLEEEVYKSCYLCIRAAPRTPELRTPKTSPLQTWTNPYNTGYELGEKDLIELPAIVDGNGSMKRGVPGKMVQVIKLHDPVTGEERSVYIKHSYVANCQQAPRLTPGMLICISHLNRRCSGTGKYYYISTMLSTLRVLDYTGCEEGQSGGWGSYGLTNWTVDPQAKMWGVLESFNVGKAAISAKCTYCNGLFYKGKCSKSCSGPGTYTLSAYAIAWLSIIQDNKTVSMEKVLIKGNFVRTLLSIPEKIWLMLEKAALEEEIIAFSDQGMIERPDSTNLRNMFQMYFSLKPREKFYISVKKLPSQDEETLYYCIQLEPVHPNRLHVVAELVNRIKPK